MDEAKYNYLYNNGIIAPWYLRKSQTHLYNLLRSKKRVVANCHRRFGKGTTILTYVFERMATEKIIVRYGAPTQKQAYDILKILIDHIYKHCPSAAPRFINGSYEFPNKSVMHVFGVKDAGEADKARGTEAHIIVADEFGFWKYKPSYILRSVLSPQLDDTDGQLFIASTPPEDLTHPFIIEELRGAEQSNFMFRWPIEKSIAIGDITESKHAKIIDRCGGTETDAYKREYQLDLIANKSRLVIPEAQEESLYVFDYKDPDYKDEYVCFDLGFKDHTFGVFGFYNFQSAMLVVVDELMENYKASSEIVSKARAIEEANVIFKPTRFGDCSDQQQLFDFSHDHGYAISPITKRSKMKSQGFRESVINGLRMAISNRRICVDKKCKNLISQLKYGIWNEKRNDFERSGEMGHLDGLMALAYLWDNIDFGSNPYPRIDPQINEWTHHINPEFYQDIKTHQFKKLIGR